MENCEYCGDIKIDSSQQDDLTLGTSTNSGYLSFCSKLITVLKNCFNLLCSICTVLLVVMGMVMFLFAALGGISNWSLEQFNSTYV